MGRDRHTRGNFGPRSNSGQNWTGGNGGNLMYNDFEPRNNRGPRSGNQAAPLMNMRTGMSRMDDDEDFTADTYGPAKNYGSMGSMGSSNKTPEQIAFDTEFTKWEQSFEDWKLNNRNHPDPSQYRVYEQKFLDVRAKLLKKRREIYGEGLGTRSGSGKNPFDNQLNAADAMANSILSKFGSMSGNSGRRNNNNNQGDGRRESRNNDNRGGNNSNRGGNNSNRGGNNGNGGGGNNDILNNELILTALKVISGNMGGPMNNMGGPMNNMGGPMNNMGGPMNNMGGPMGGGPMGGPMFSRGYGGGGYGGGYNDGPYGGGYGRGYGRGYDDGYGRGNNNGNGPRYGPGSRRPGGDSRLGPKRTTISRDDPTKKNTPNKRKRKPAGEKKDPTEAEIDSRTPFLDRIPIMYELARNTELPKLLSGAANRRLKVIKMKEPEKVTDREKYFIEYAEYVFNKRDEYYKLHPKEEKTDDAAAAADKTAEAKVEDVEMNEDELLKD